MPTGHCSMVFHAWYETDDIIVEILEYSAWVSGFQYREKSEYEKYQFKRSLNDWFHESWSESSYKIELAKDVAKEANVVLGEDRYFEYIAEYSLDPHYDHYGEYDEEESITNPRGQEISQLEYGI